MHLEALRRYCLAKPGASEDLPFDEDTLVFKVLGKMFALTRASNPVFVNLKCDPDRALELRAVHEAVQPGYHMNKRHWNTVRLDGLLTDDFVLELIDHSYDLVVQGLPKRKRERLTGG